MKLYRVTNEYLGDGEVHLLVVAADRERALELAAGAFQQQAAGRYSPDYWTRLGAAELCGDLQAEWTGEVED